MHSIPTLLVDLTLITIYAGIITLVFKKLSQPTVLGYILAGILAGPYFNLLPTVTDKENLALWADIGVIFLLFGLGLEFSFHKMINVGKSAMITALANIVFMLFAGYNTGLLLGWPATDSFFLGSMISMSSTTIIIKAFDDLNIKKRRFTDLVFGVLVVEDMVGILLLVLLPTIALSSVINSTELMVSTLKLAFFLVLCFVIGIYLVPTFLSRIIALLNDEMLLLITVSLCFGMVLLATYSGFSSALGAFVMGSILAETELTHRIEHVLKPLKDFFGAVFFVSVGMMVNPAMFLVYAKPIAVITLVVVIGKVFFSCIGFLFSGQNLKTSVEGGFSLAQVGEFAFIIAGLGMSLGVLNERVYPTIVAVSVITTFFTPMMIKAADPFYDFGRRLLPEKWLGYIERNAAPAAESQIEERRWKLLFKNYTLRLILVSMVLTAVLLTATYFIKPWVHALLPNLWARVTVTAITLALMSPFLKALIGWEGILPLYLKQKIAAALCRLSSYKAKRPQDGPTPLQKVGAALGVCKISGQAEAALDYFISNHKIAALYYKLWSSNKVNRLPLILLTSFRLIVVMLFIVAAVHLFLTENPKMTALLLG